MLRTLIVGLLIANLAYFAWTQGWLSPWIGASPTGERDPERLERQVNPQAVQILSPAAASRLNSVAAPACVEAGPFDGTQVEAAEAALTTLLPAGNWTRVVRTVPGTWIVYMGKYLDTDTYQRKQAELRRLRVGFEALPAANAELAPGLLLGRYETQAAAESALDQFANRGVRTARVVPLVQPRSAWLLRIEGADPSVVAQAVALRNDALGRGFAACGRVASGAASAPRS